MITASIVSYHHKMDEIRKVMDCVLASPVDKLFIIDNSSNDRLRELGEISERVRYIHSVNRIWCWTQYCNSGINGFRCSLSCCGKS